MCKNCECKGTFIIIIKWLFVLGHLEYSCLYACKWAQGLKYLLTFRTYVQQNMHKSATAEQAMSSEISSFIHNFPLKTHHLSGILPNRSNYGGQEAMESFAFPDKCLFFCQIAHDGNL